jgi:adenylate cyclase
MMAVMADDDLPPGLVDPHAPDADAQRTVAAYYLRHGIPIEEVRAAIAAGTLTNLVSAAALWPDASRLTVAEVARRAGTSEELTRRVRRMFGAIDPGDEALCRPREVEMISSFVAGASLFGEERTLQFTRVMGTSAAAIAEAALTLFAGTVGAPLREAGRTDAEYAVEALVAMTAFETVCVAVDVSLRLHFEQAVARIGGEVAVDELTFAVAFVDVVASTAMAGELTGNEVATVLRDFDRIVAEGAYRYDVRLVKLIGDGALLAARDVAPLANAVAEIVTRIDVHAVLKAAKAGLTFGPVAAHDGDYFGQVVNLAARASSAAMPGEVLLDDEAANALPGRTEPAGDYDLKGFPDPVPLHRLVPPEARR